MTTEINVNLLQFDEDGYSYLKIPMDQYKKSIDEGVIKNLVVCKALPCCLGYQDKGIPDINEIAGNVTEIIFDEEQKRVIGKIKVIDTPYGEILQNLLNDQGIDNFNYVISGKSKTADIKNIKDFEMTHISIVNKP